MDFGLAFGFVFDDPEWFRKVAIPALCGLVPVVGPFVIIGWALKVAKNVMDGKAEQALPEVEFGADLGKGFMASLISGIYSLPAVLLIGIGAGLISLSSNADDVISAILIIAAIFMFLIALVLLILIALLTATGLSNYVAKGKFGAAFHFKTLFKMIQKFFGPWVLVIVGYILAVGLIAPLGSIVCGIGALLTTAYGYAVFTHLLGQAYNLSADRAVETVDEF